MAVSLAQHSAVPLVAVTAGCLAVRWGGQRAGTMEQNWVVLSVDPLAVARAEMWAASKAVLWGSRSVVASVGKKAV